MADHHDVHVPKDVFAFDGRWVQTEHTTIGHINDTYIVQYRSSAATGDGTHRYVMQRINHHVFKNPEQVMANIEAVTAHLRRKIEQAGGDPNRETLNIVRTKNGDTFHRTETGDYWRAYHFIDGAKTYEAADNPVHFYNAGKAFGHFQKLLADFPAASLHETIPQFHDTRQRFLNLMGAVQRDAAGRAADVQDDIAFATQRESMASVVVDMLADGTMPLRVVHNDTKLNNVLIDDESGEGICVLDLDTVMPGSSLYDFGDAIRFGASTGAEDEPDLTKVNLDLNLFAQFTKGFIESAGDALTDVEYDHLAFSAKLITYEIGLRFLTDHLDGDVYFRVTRPNHNLDRARTQFKLVADMEAKMADMEAIVTRERQRVRATS